MAASAIPIGAKAVKPRRCRIWLSEWRAGDLTPCAATHREPVTFRDCAFDERVRSVKLSEPLCSDSTHAARELERGDAVFRASVERYSRIDLPNQIYVVHSVEVLP